MKKVIALALLPLLLSACGSDEYVHSTEPRSNVYYGQPVADLYENFGAPTKATHLSENERVLIYVKQEIEKDWAYRYLRGCVMKFYLKDERVVAWSSDGQACVIPSTGGNITEIDSRKPKANTQEVSYGLFDEIDDTPMTQYFPTGGQVPADAFEGKAGTTYGNIQSIQENKLSGKASETLLGNNQLPADAFDGKASTTYHSIKRPIVNNGVNGVYTVPTDAFDGKASTIYRPVTPTNSMPTIQSSSAMILPADAFDGKASTVYRPVTPTNSMPTIQSSSATILPADAFDGKASTVYHQPSTQATQKNRSWLSSDEDEWGLFDN